MWKTVTLRQSGSDGAEIFTFPSKYYGGLLSSAIAISAAKALIA